MRTQPLIFLVAVVVSPSYANAMTVLSNSAYVSESSVDDFEWTAEFRITVDQDVYGDYTSVWLEYDLLNSTLEVVNWNLDEESDWYIVQPGEVFSASGIAAGNYPVLFTSDNPRPPVPTDFTTYDTADFIYLGYNTGTLWDDEPPYELADYRDVFGWVKIGVKPWDNIYLEWYAADSAAAYGAAGIVVGTTTGIEIPEPASWMLAAAAVCGLWRLTRCAPLLTSPPPRPQPCRRTTGRGC